MPSEEVATQGLVGRPHMWQVRYKVTMDSAGPFHYRLFVTPFGSADQTADEIRSYLGAHNIKELFVDRRDKHQVAVELLLVSDEIKMINDVFSNSPMTIKDDIMAVLPEEHLVGIEVLSSLDLGGHGPHR